MEEKLNTTPVTDITLAATEASISVVKETTCDDMKKMFKDISLDDILSMPDVKLPKIDLSGLKFDVECKFKFDEMFKDFSIAFPDVELPKLDFKPLFDFLANALKLPSMDKLKTPHNPLEGLGDGAKELFDKYTKCDNFKNGLADGVQAISKTFEPKLEDYV